MPTSPVVAFYRGEMPDSQGRRLADIQAWDDERLEIVHDYIQWLFPLPERSAFNPKAPLLAPGTRYDLDRVLNAGGHELYVEETMAAATATADQTAVAERALAHLADRFGTAPAYARVDLLPGPDGPVVVELEVVEPSLFLGYAPDPDAAADRCVRVCRRDPRDSADAEQSLFEQLDATLDRARQGQPVPLAVRGTHWYQDLVLRPDELDGFCAALAKQGADGVAEAVRAADLPVPPRAVWLTRPAARLPRRVALRSRCIGPSRLGPESKASLQPPRPRASLRIRARRATARVREEPARGLVTW